jgi:hypothetical protein
MKLKAPMWRDIPAQPVEREGGVTEIRLGALLGNLNSALPPTNIPRAPELNLPPLEKEPEAPSANKLENALFRLSALATTGCSPRVKAKIKDMIFLYIFSSS